MRPDVSGRHNASRQTQHDEADGDDDEDEDGLVLVVPYVKNAMRIAEDTPGKTKGGGSTSRWAVAPKRKVTGKRKFANYIDQPLPKRFRDEQV